MTTFLPPFMPIPPAGLSNWGQYPGYLIRELFKDIGRLFGLGRDPELAGGEHYKYREGIQPPALYAAVAESNDNIEVIEKLLVKQRKALGESGAVSSANENAENDTFQSFLDEPNPHMAGATALSRAVTDGHTNVIKLLIEYGAQQLPNKHGILPNFIATKYENGAILQLLLDAPPNIRGPVPDELLFEAAKHGSAEIARLLAAKVENVNALNGLGQTPCHVGSALGFYEFVKVLVEVGAEVDVEDKKGETPLYLAAVEGNDDIVTLLIGAGAHSKHEIFGTIVGFGLETGDNSSGDSKSKFTVSVPVLEMLNNSGSRSIS